MVSWGSEYLPDTLLIVVIGIRKVRAIESAILSSEASTTSCTITNINLDKHEEESMREIITAVKCSHAVTLAKLTIAMSRQTQQEAGRSKNL